MAIFTILKSGSWRTQVGRKGTYVNEILLRRIDAEDWTLDVEQRIDRQEPTTNRKSRDAHRFLNLADAREKMEERHKHYNEERPHRAIGQKPPMMLLNRVGASSPLS